MKKSLLIFGIAAFSLQSVVSINSAHAVVQTYFEGRELTTLERNAGIVLATGVACGTASGILYLIDGCKNEHPVDERSDDEKPGKVQTFFKHSGQVLEAVSLIMLAAEPNQPNSYQELTDETASKFGITGEERNSFNHELAEVNAISDSVAADIDLELSSEQRINAIKEGWIAAKDSISPLTMSALSKLANGVLASVQ